MEEVWRLLGIGKMCSTCLVKQEDMGSLEAVAPARSVSAAVAAVRRARALVAKGFGNKTAALEELQKEALLPFHLQQWNPFLLLPHMDFACFPMDRLHGMYVKAPVC